MEKDPSFLLPKNLLKPSEKTKFVDMISNIKTKEDKKRKLLLKNEITRKKKDKKIKIVQHSEPKRKNVDDSKLKKTKTQKEKKRYKKKNSEYKSGHTFHNTELYNNMAPFMSFRSEELDMINSIDPFSAPKINDLESGSLSNQDNETLHRFSQLNQETRKYMGLSDKKKKDMNLLFNSFDEQSSNYRDLNTNQSHFNENDSSQPEIPNNNSQNILDNILQEKYVFENSAENPVHSKAMFDKTQRAAQSSILCDPQSEKSGYSEQLYVGAAIEPSGTEKNFSIDLTRNSKTKINSKKHKDKIEELVSASDTQRLSLIEDSMVPLFSSGNVGKKVQEKLGLDSIQVVSPMRDFTSHLVNAPSKPAKELMNRVGYNLQDSINADIDWISKNESKNMIYNRKQESKEPGSLAGNFSNTIDPVQNAFEEDKPFDSMDAFYSGQLVGPSLRQLVNTVVEEEKRHEVATTKEFLSGDPAIQEEQDRQKQERLLMGPKERMLRILINKEKEKDNLYRWRADKGYELKEMNYRPMGNPVSMEYALDFLREPIGDERPCIRGSTFCISVLLPQMQIYPRTTDTQLSDMGFVGREFFTKNELDFYMRSGKWPEVRGCCFLCLVFEQTMKCATVIETKRRFPYQIQRFTILIEEGQGFSHNQILPQLTPEEEPTGIVGSALEFKTNDYIPTTTMRHVGSDIVKVKCYNFAVHLF